LRLGEVEGEHRERLVCDNCGHIVYINPRLVVTAFPVTDAGDLVLLRRGIEPGYGSWAQPGGFLEVDETVNQAAIRETLEETGLLIEPTEIIGLYTRLEAAVVTIAFEARIVGGAPRPSRFERSRRRTSPGTTWLSRRRCGRCATGLPCAAPSSNFPR
jgi:ADP-ribose pyrophosphatase YjhB (NUDIX family)